MALIVLDRGTATLECRAPDGHHGQQAQLTESGAFTMLLASLQAVRFDVEENKCMPTDLC